MKSIFYAIRNGEQEKCVLSFLVARSILTWLALRRNNARLNFVSNSLSCPCEQKFWPSLTHLFVETGLRQLAQRVCAFFSEDKRIRPACVSYLTPSFGRWRQN